MQCGYVWNADNANHQVLLDSAEREKANLTYFVTAFTHCSFCIALGQDFFFFPTRHHSATEPLLTLSLPGPSLPQMQVILLSQNAHREQHGKVTESELVHLLLQAINYRVPFFQIKCICKSNPAVAAKADSVRPTFCIHLQS